MHFLLSPDKFKNSLGAREVAQSIADGLREVFPDAVIDLVPVADGGEGTAAAIGQARDGRWMTCQAHDALGRPIQARYVWLGDSSTAVMEMSEAAGLWRIASQERDPMRSNTAGVGEMLLDAISHDAQEIVIGLGGSATNDGGLGLGRSLGFEFFDSNGAELTNGPADLVRLERITRKAELPRQVPRIIAATDVRNRLLGERGATRTFGPQKGASPVQVQLLEEALTRLADTVARDLGIDHREVPGSGAAGGLAFGLMSFCGATIRPGFEVVAEAIGLETRMKQADVVITGEGSLDGQTLQGKAPAGVAKLAQVLGKRIFAIVGRADDSQQVREIFEDILTLDGPIEQTRDRLRARGRELAVRLKNGL